MAGFFSSLFARLKPPSATVQSVVDYVGLDVLLPLVESRVIAEASKTGMTGITRMIELPEATIITLCHASGADPALAAHKIHAAAQSEADAMIYVATGHDMAAAVVAEQPVIQATPEATPLYVPQEATPEP